MKKGSEIPHFHIQNNRVKVSIGKTYNLEDTTFGKKYESLRLDYTIEGDIPEGCSVKVEIEEIQKYIVSVIQSAREAVAEDLISK